MYIYLVQKKNHLDHSSFIATVYKEIILAVNLCCITKVIKTIGTVVQKRNVHLVFGFQHT